jgi:hypothetical protein
MTTVLLGNPAPMMQRRVHHAGLPEDVAEEIGIKTISVPAPHVNQSITRVDMREGFDDAEECELALTTSNDRMLVLVGRQLDDDLKRYAIGVLEIEQIMSIHSGGVAPTWVSCDDQNFEEALSQHFDCLRGEPVALLTTVGRDALHAQHMSTSAQPASFNYIAVSANATAASAASTTLPGEITTGGGGLVRAQATYAHTGSTNTTTLTKTFTANGSDTLPVTLAKIGVLNAASVGTLAYETLLNATATLTISGDNIVITETVTAG